MRHLTDPELTALERQLVAYALGISGGRGEVVWVYLCNTPDRYLLSAAYLIDGAVVRAEALAPSLALEYGATMQQAFDLRNGTGSPFHRVTPREFRLQWSRGDRPLTSLLSYDDSRGVDAPAHMKQWFADLAANGPVEEL